MGKILIYFLLGISLSMDAFSLSLVIGASSFKKHLSLAIIIGLFHFFMPFIGNRIGLLLSSQFQKISHIGMGIIFMILALEMFFNQDHKEQEFTFHWKEIILIGLTVSLDSLTVGLAFGLNQEETILASMIFQLVSTFFTYLGLKLGSWLQQNNQKRALMIGIIVMLLIGLKYLLFA